jgi:DNA polymerase-4
VSETNSHPTGDLLDPSERNRAKAERATDKIRAKFGSGSIVKGRSLR